MYVARNHLSHFWTSLNIHAKRYVPSLRFTRGLGWHMHCGAEVTESSTNKQHHLSPSRIPQSPDILTGILSILWTHRLSDAHAPDWRLYTSHPRPLSTGTVNTVRINSHGCVLRPEPLKENCIQPHPSTVKTAPHHPHTRPPDIQAHLSYQRSLVNTYCTSDLCRQLARQGNHLHNNVQTAIHH